MSGYFDARFQVNPYGYIERHGQTSDYDDEESYNDAILEACQEHGVEVVAITDHFRFDSSEALADLLVEAGIKVFPGFEANSSEGIHLLCLFPPAESTSKMNTHIGACGVSNWDVESPQADKTAEEISRLIARRGGLTIAAHACGSSGILAVKTSDAPEIITIPPLIF